MMKRNGFPWILVVALILLSGGGLFIYIPYKKRAQTTATSETTAQSPAPKRRDAAAAKAAGRAGKADVEAAAAAREKPPAHNKSQDVAILPDGSFNIIPPRVIAPGESPESLTAGMDWRARYEPALGKTREGSTKVYVYCFNDRTAEGVGLVMTYGAHTTGGAMLAARTDAEPAHQIRPLNWGWTDLDEKHPDGILDTKEYQKRALDDPATASAKYLILGEYADAGDPRKAKLEAWMIARDKPDDRIAIYSGDADLPGGRVDVEGKSFDNLARQQRECMAKVCDVLVGRKLAHARVGDETAVPDLDAELREVALMLNANDSRGVMDGIDRALGLTALRPGSSAALQAAAYGMNLLGFMAFEFQAIDTHATDYGMRGFGLAQAALAVDEKPTLSKLEFALNARLMGHLAMTRFEALGGSGGLGGVPDELSGLRDIVYHAVSGLSKPSMQPYMPDWLVLAAESRPTTHFGKPGPFRKYYETRMNEGGKKDLFLPAMINYHGSGAYIRGTGEYFEEQHRASAIALGGYVANEIAEVLSAPSVAGGDSSVHEELKKKAGLDVDGLKELAAAGKFHEVRGLLLARTKKWPSPRIAGHPANRVLAVLHGACEKIMAAPENHARISPFAGLEFTPAERVLFAQRRDARGAIMAAEFFANLFGSYEDMLRVMDEYLAARPSSASGWLEYAELINHFSAFDDHATRRVDALEKAHGRRMLEICLCYRRGRSLYYLEREDQALALLKQSNRLDPYNTGRFADMAEFCKRYRFHADAVIFYDLFLLAYPQRYDMRNDRSWSLCQMGRWKDPELREHFAEPVKMLVGNPSFHEANVDYLLNWLEDFPAARKAAQLYATAKGRDGQVKMVRVAIKEGDKEKALKLLGNIGPGNAVGLGLAQHHAEMAELCIELGDLDKAAMHVKKAADVDDWKGDVIAAMGDLAFAKGDYAEARAEFNRYLERYGPSDWNLLRIAKCDYKLGNLNDAVEVLSSFVVGHNRHRASPAHAIELLKIHAEEGNKAEAKLVFDRILTMTRCYRGDIYLACEAYKKVDEERAKGVQGAIDQLMTGPSIFFPNGSPISTLTGSMGDEGGARKD